MDNKPIIDVFTKNELCVYGKDIRRIRANSNLSRKAVCDKMKLIGFGYYEVKLLRYETQTKLCLPAHEMMSLVSALNADYDLK